MFVDDTKAKFYLFDQVKNLTNNEGKCVGKILVRYGLLLLKRYGKIYTLVKQKESCVHMGN